MRRRDTSLYVSSMGYRSLAGEMLSKLQPASESRMSGYACADAAHVGGFRTVPLNLDFLPAVRCAQPSVCHWINRLCLPVCLHDIWSIFCIDCRSWPTRMLLISEMISNRLRLEASSVQMALQSPCASSLLLKNAVMSWYLMAGPYALQVQSLDKQSCMVTKLQW